MNFGRGNLTSVLRNLEQGYLLESTRSLHGHTALTRRMRCSAILNGHGGCVNRLALSEDSTLLLSGSDDCQLGIWDVETYGKGSPKALLAPGHDANIFGVAFMPNTSNHYVASAGLDRQVRLTNVVTGSSTLWTCHDKMVKTISAIDTNTFVSASNDGTARLFDSRLPPKPHAAQQENVIIQIPNRRNGLTGLSSAMVSPLSSNHLVVAANDSHIRVFDLRLSVSNRASNADQPGHRLSSLGYCAENMCPPHLHEMAPEQQTAPMRSRQIFSPHVTYATFSSDAKQIVASYYDDTVFVFDRSHYVQPVMCRSPFLSRSAKQTAILQIIDDAAKLLLTDHNSKAVIRTNHALEMDPSNMTALLYKAHALLRRDSPGDSRAAYAILEQLIDLITNDPQNGALLWPFNHNIAEPTLPERNLSKADVWIKVFLYMQATALYGMVPPFQCSMLPYIRSSERFYMKKRLEHLSGLCLALENYLKNVHGPSELSKNALRGFMRRRALGTPEERESFCQSTADKRRLKVLSGLLNSFLIGISQLQKRVSARIANLLPRDRDDEVPHRITASEDSWSSDSDEREDNVGKVDDMISEVEEGNMKMSENGHNIWGPCLSVVPKCRSFYGHTSSETDIKEANFYGSKNQVVISGSDDGFVYMWCARSSELLAQVQGDGSIVNCVLPHPYHTMIICSGIDNTIKLITPSGEEVSEIEEVSEMNGSKTC